MNNILSKVKPDSSSSSNLRQILYSILLSLALGVIFGFIAKYSDTKPSNGLAGVLWGTVSQVTTRLGIWVLLGTIISTWSKKPLHGAIKVLSFFVGMLVMYYIYSQWIFNFFPTYYFIRWGAIALASPIAGYIVWFSRKEGWLGTLSAAMPIGFLLSQGYPFIYTFNVVTGFDLLFAFILFIPILGHKTRILPTFLAALLIGYIINVSNVVSYFFGGL